MVRNAGHYAEVAVAIALLVGIVAVPLVVFMLPILIFGEGGVVVTIFGIMALHTVLLFGT